MAVKSKGVFPKLWRFIKRLFIILFLLQLLYIFLLKWINPPFTLTQAYSWIRGDGLKRDYVNMNEISSYAKLALIASEDQLFPVHNGFDWKSIEKALEHNNKSGRRVRGASTISQQVAKNVFLWQGKSFFRKGLEMYFTFMIELIWGKKRILEMYLNVSEMGKGVFGIEAASQHYFKQPAKKLSRKQAALIASCMPNPKLYTIHPMSKYVARKHPWVLKQMNNLQNDADVQELIQ